MKKFLAVSLVCLLSASTYAWAVSTKDTWKFEGPVIMSGAVTQSGTVTQSGAVTQSGPVYSSVEAVTTTAEALLVAADCGKTILLNHATAGIDVFLPAPVSGCYFKTVVFVAFSDDHTINTNAGADIMVGHINEIANTSTGVSDTNADILTLVDTAESIGDYCEFISDGTSWYFTCTVGVDGAMTSGTT